MPNVGLQDFNPDARSIEYLKLQRHNRIALYVVTEMLKRVAYGVLLLGTVIVSSVLLRDSDFLAGYAGLVWIPILLVWNYCDSNKNDTDNESLESMLARAAEERQREAKLPPALQVRVHPVEPGGRLFSFAVRNISGCVLQDISIDFSRVLHADGFGVDSTHMHLPAEPEFSEKIMLPNQTATIEIQKFGSIEDYEYELNAFVYASFICHFEEVETKFTRRVKVEVAADAQ